MVEIPKTWKKQDETNTSEQIDEIFFEFTTESSDIKVHTASYTHLNKEGELGEHILVKIVPNKKFDWSNLETLKKGKFFEITQELADRYNQFLKWADGEEFKVITKVESLPYEITRKDGKIGKTNPQIKPEINKCQKMVGREAHTIWVIGYKKLSQDEDKEI